MIQASAVYNALPRPPPSSSSTTSASASRPGTSHSRPHSRPGTAPSGSTNANATLPTTDAFPASSARARLRRRPAPHLAVTGHPTLDARLLCGGLAHGRGGVVALAAAELDVANAVCNAFVAEHVTRFARSGARAWVLDSGGGVRVEAVARGVRRRLNEEEKVEEALGRVGVMRTFDLVGAMDCVEEVARELRAGSKKRKKVVADSQAEEGDEPMDLDASVAAAAEEEDEEEEPPSLLVLSHLPPLVSPLMRRNHVTGHALLLSLTRKLRHLTRSHPLCVLLVNGVVGVGEPRGEPRGESRGESTRDTRSEAPRNTIPQPRREQQQQQQQHPSAFADLPGRPALGRSFAHEADVSLLCAGRVGGVAVLECVGDRFGAPASAGRGGGSGVQGGSRVGRWCGVVVGRDGEVKGVE